MKWFWKYKKFGYITLTQDSGKVIPINIRSIMIYKYYENSWTPTTKTRLYYLNGDFENIRESAEEIDSMIKELI